MKKLLLVCALGTFVACKNGAATDSKTDSTAVTNPPAATTEPTPASTEPVKADTTKAVAAPATTEPAKMEAGKDAKAEVKEADKMEKK